MTYKSPIEIINEKVTERFDDGVMKAIYQAEFQVDKYELYKALRYDRGQYDKGYADRDHEIVRCKDCKYYREDGDCWHEWDNDGRIYYQSIINEPNPDDYCSRAKRKEE